MRTELRNSHYGPAAQPAPSARCMIDVEILLKNFVDGAPVVDATVELTLWVGTRVDRVSGVSDCGGVVRARLNPAGAFAMLSGRVLVGGLDLPIDFDAGADLSLTGGLVRRTIEIDFAKCLVGHTTTTSTKLWFQLHGEVRGGDHYLCELSLAGSGEMVRTIPVVFNPVKANTCLLEVGGLQPETQYLYRLRLREPKDQQAGTPGRAVGQGEFATRSEIADGLSFVHTADAPQDWGKLARSRNYQAILVTGESDAPFEDRAFRTIVSRTPTYLTSGYEHGLTQGCFDLGPAAFFAGSKDQTVQDLQVWAASPVTRAADVIFVLSQAPWEISEIVRGLADDTHCGTGDYPRAVFVLDRSASGRMEIERTLNERRSYRIRTSAGRTSQSYRVDLDARCGKAAA